MEASVRRPEWDGKGERTVSARFSIPAYLASMLAASETVALLMSATFSYEGDFSPLVWLAAIAIAPLGGLVALPLFLPATLCGLLIAKVWRIERPVVYGAIGAALSGLTGIVLALPGFRPESPGMTLAQILASTCPVAGFVGGFTYRCVARQEMRNILT